MKKLFTRLSIVATIIALTQCQQKTRNSTKADDGERLFSRFCVRCHQSNGIGGPTPASGPVPGEGVEAMDIQRSTKSEQELVAFISNGWGKMPSFKDSTSSENIELIARYVATKIEHR